MRLVIAAAGIYLSQGPEAKLSPVIGLWFVAVPVFDLFSTIFRRLAERKSPFAPDHEHLHHVLVEHGLSRTETFVCVLVLAASFAAAGLLAHSFVVPDGVMFILWFAGGAFYYQMMRYPGLIVACIRAIRAVEEPPTDLPERSSSARRE